MGRVPWSPRGLQLLGARHRQHGDDRALRLAPSMKRAVARAAARRQDPQRLRDDRAGRSPRPTRPTSQRASSARATTTSSTAASGGPRGAGDPRCKVYIFMGKTDPDAPRHSQQSMILVPADTPGHHDPAAAHRCSATTTRRTATWRSTSRTCACRPATSCSAKAAASRSPRAASGRAASTTACA